MAFQTVYEGWQAAVFPRQSCFSHAVSIDNAITDISIFTQFSYQLELTLATRDWLQSPDIRILEGSKIERNLSLQTPSDFLDPMPQTATQKSPQCDAIGVADSARDFVDAFIRRLQEMHRAFYAQLLKISQG